MKNNYDWKSVPMPDNIHLYCKVDPRGLPVPYVVLEDDNGTFHFKVNDSKKISICLMEYRCSICGQIMPEDDRWLVGGIASAFDKNGVYIDTPVHHDCGEYALKVCPYLAVRNYNSKLDLDKLKSKIAIQGSISLHDSTVDTDRLPLFVLAQPVKYKFVVRPPGNLYIVPSKPFKRQEYWDEGVQLTIKEALEKIEGTKWEKYSKFMEYV